MVLLSCRVFSIFAVAGVLKSIKAGVDWALWVSTEKVGSVLDRLESAYNAGELNGDAINASVRRVLAFKGVAACG